MQLKQIWTFVGLAALLLVMGACTTETAAPAAETAAEHEHSDRLQVVKDRGKVICASRNDVSISICACSVFNLVLWYS